MSRSFDDAWNDYETFLSELAAMFELARLPYRNLSFYLDTKKFNEHFERAVEYGRIFDEELFKLPDESSVDEKESVT